MKGGSKVLENFYHVPGNEEKLGIGSSGYLMWFILAANLLGLPAISVPVSVVYLFRKNPI
jgi:hypothetical protein